ncbi:two-component system response regulator [Burkholderia sp. ABCPW 14]|uniref:response regulator transcription factor n=1 Tax=Burkholderia sp. ABCPW 14 TaxID=1637860 RepID=UPI000770D6B9|nr:response regulator transcription factor [Burkholderia sp. ABCPW 14]KVD73536.1 two-component system response regulator [Burkholderia sp. ABCPW 14]
MKLLLVEDDPAQADAINSALRANGHDIIRVHNVEAAIRFLKAEALDLIILDWQLPTMSGLEMLRWIRTYRGDEPAVLFLTRRMFEADIVLALEAGADECVAKSVRMPELTARVNAILRRVRRPDQTTQIIRVGNYVIDAHQRSISLRGTFIDVTEREFDVVAYLFKHIGKVVSRDLLAKLAWGRDLDCMSRTIDTHVYRIRRKLSIRPENGACLNAVYTQGYRLDEVSHCCSELLQMEE